MAGERLHLIHLHPVKDLKSLPGTLRERWKYTLHGTLVHHTHRGDVAEQIYFLESANKNQMENEANMIKL